MNSEFGTQACQEPLTHLINGLLLTFNDKFQPGEEVKFGDVAGFVTSMGWFDTHVRRYDESTASEIRVVSRRTRRNPCSFRFKFPTGRSWGRS